jgi:hypothetical protein
MSLNREKYQAFANLLEQFCDYTTINEPDAPGLRQRTVSLQQFFQQQIAPLADEDVDSPNASREQSYRTEMSKQLRLLEMDVMFFQGARQASTATARLQTIGDRLTTLLKYCDAVLQLKQTEE